jgi:hypothetical protein
LENAQVLVDRIALPLYIYIAQRYGKGHLEIRKREIKDTAY